MAVHDAGGGIDVGVGRIGLDQTRAEAVNGRAGDFAERGARGREIVVLRLRQAIGQRQAQFGRYVAGREDGDNFADTRENFLGRQLGDGYGAYDPGWDTTGDNHDDTFGHAGAFA